MAAGHRVENYNRLDARNPHTNQQRDGGDDDGEPQHQTPAAALALRHGADTVGNRI